VGRSTKFVTLSAVVVTGRRFAFAIVLIAALAVSCRSRSEPVTVAVTFANSWKVGGEPLSDEEQLRVRAAALGAMRRAFAGFDVVVSDAPPATRMVRVEDTPYGRLTLFGAAGVTYPAAHTSSVRFDILANLLLAVVQCHDLTHCSAMPRAALVDGLGRGIGATAAHELGHQAGFRFALDSACDDCYDSNASTSFAHFFASKHWSDRALHIMERTLPQRGRWAP
jgi:hypothetical protein